MGGRLSLYDVVDDDHDDDRHDHKLFSIQNCSPYFHQLVITEKCMHCCSVVETIFMCVSDSIIIF